MSETSEGPITKPADRDQTGRFVAGSKGNRSGNPSTRRQRVRSKAMKLLLDELLKDDAARLRSIVEGWVSDAVNNQTARRHLLDRLLGLATDSEALAAIERIQTQVGKLAAKGSK